jgi:hypothetical protein
MLQGMNLCAMTFSDAITYFEVNNLNAADDKLAQMIPDYCFLSSYTYILLTEGYGFPKNETFTVLDEVNNNKVSWAFGAIMHEINTMPWVYLPATQKGSEVLHIAVAAILGKIDVE